MMTETERKAYEAAMRGAKFLDDRTNFKWVEQVKLKDRRRSVLAQVNAIREANGDWARREDETAHPGSGTLEFDGRHYGFYEGPHFNRDSISNDKTLNAAWQKVVRRRQYLRDLRKRRKMGLTPGTRLTVMKTDGRVEASL